MANLFDYLTWRGDLNFNQSPFNPVDNVIFSQLTYLPMDGIVPGPDEKGGISIRLTAKILSEKFNKPLQQLKLDSSVIFNEDPDFIAALGSTNRFGDCQLLGYVNHIDTDREVQFSAVSIKTGDDSCFIAFRGTDFNLVGWKEDFNMSFKDVIPSQLEAVKYLEKMASRFKCPLRLVGHSKGGNLAVYAAANCKKNIQNRITEIYTNDAPGFDEKFINSENFLTVRERIRSFIPQSSVIGMLLDSGCSYSVIKSSQVGLIQHVMYSWEVTHNDLVYVDTVDSGSLFLDKTLKEWIGNLDKKHREQFLNALFSILSASGAKSIPELERSWVKAVGNMIKSLGNIDESTKKLIGKTFGDLFNAAMRNFDTLLKPKKPKKK